MGEYKKLKKNKNLKIKALEGRVIKQIKMFWIHFKNMQSDTPKGFE